MFQNKEIIEKAFDKFASKASLPILLGLLLLMVLLFGVILGLSFLIYAGILAVAIFIFNFVAPAIAWMFWMTAVTATFSWAWALWLWLGIITYKTIKYLINGSK